MPAAPDLATAPPAAMVVALAASAGGLKALSRVLASLPADFAAAVVVVQHLMPGRLSLLADILARRTPLRVKQAEEGDSLCAGTVYVAPPDHHLIVGPGGRLRLTRTPLVHFSRPSADVLLESLAAAFPGHSVAVVLTGTGRDGAGGAGVVRRAGGFSIAQDPATAEFIGMPGAAVAAGVDFILSLDDIAPALIGLVREGRLP